MKDIANPEETFEEKTVERPNSCAIRMPWELYKILNWKSNEFRFIIFLNFVFIKNLNK